MLNDRRAEKVLITVGSANKNCIENGSTHARSEEMGYGLKSKVAGFDKRCILNKSKTRYIKIDQEKQVKGGKKGAF